jgi:DNA-binding response OmpR family regulator
MRKIIWADDEIELLRPHIMFLQDRGYHVTPVTNGEDAISKIQREEFDIVLLDEMMTGKDGLTTLEEIKSTHPDLPVIMITKNEEESLMEDAIGRQIDSYLTKPVNPSQILMACKHILDKQKITGQKLARDYIREFNRISQRLTDDLTYRDWYDIHATLCQWEIELTDYSDLGLHQSLADQKRSCNIEFGRFVERHYRDWLNDRSDRSPALSVDVIPRFVFPKIAARRPVVLFVIDCLRLDQWLGFESILRDFFQIEKNFFMSILPTATPYSRNAIFAGMFPLEIEKKFPEIWSKGEEDDTSRNRFEKELLDFQLQRHQVPLSKEARYIKILNQDQARALEQNAVSYAESSELTAIVINFLDILAHSRSDSNVIKEIAPDEAAYRSLSTSWFLHSSLLETFKKLAKTDCTIIITSDHGSIRSLHGTQVVGDREASTALRYKVGRNLKVNPKHAVILKNPAEFKLPSRGVNTSYIIAKEDYYFVYPTNYHHFLNYYKDTFQHGGISMEEMIMPVIEMTGK